MKSRDQRQYRKRDRHFLDPDGMVACNPRDKEASHRAEVEDIAESVRLTSHHPLLERNES
jgi:hypothetical protein